MNGIRMTEAEKKEIREAKEDVVYLRILVEMAKDPAEKMELEEDLHSARMYCRLLEENILNLPDEEEPDEEELDAMMEAALPRRKIKWLVKAITVAVLLAIIFTCASCQFASGCGRAVQGLGGDIQWLADGYIEESKK